MSVAGDVIFRLLFSDAGLFGIGLLTAKLALPIVSLGRIRVLPIGSPEDNGRQPDGKLGITANLASLIGVLIWFAAGAAYGLWRVYG